MQQDKQPTRKAKTPLLWFWIGSFSWVLVVVLFYLSAFGGSMVLEHFDRVGWIGSVLLRLVYVVQLAVCIMIPSFVADWAFRRQAQHGAWFGRLVWMHPVLSGFAMRLFLGRALWPACVVVGLACVPLIWLHYRRRAVRGGTRPEQAVMRQSQSR